MKNSSVRKIAEGAYFVVDTLNYFNQAPPFNLTLAMQTISAVPSAELTGPDFEDNPVTTPEAAEESTPDQ